MQRAPERTNATHVHGKSCQSFGLSTVKEYVLLLPHSSNHRPANPSHRAMDPTRDFVGQAQANHGWGLRDNVVCITFTSALHDQVTMIQ